MEPGNSKNKVAVLAYECIGTAFMTYALVIERSVYLSGVTLLAMLAAWDISGGHFNPAISISVYCNEKKNGA